MNENSRLADNVLRPFVTIRVSRDRLLAELDLGNPPFVEEGMAYGADDLLELLQEHGVWYGLIPTEELQRLLDAWLGPVKDFTVAQGLTPVSATEDLLAFLFDQDPTPRPLALEDGTVDFRELGILQDVTEGQVLVRKIPGDPGIPGISVHGDEIAPKPARFVKIPMGKGTILNDDGDELRAAMAGHVVCLGNGQVTVQPVYHVKEDVDFSVGNIDFRGSVIVHGNVRSGFAVKADGTIEVAGMVEAANLEAGGDIIIRGGVQGSPRTQIRAQGQIRALYLQNANARAEGDVIVSDSIMHSVVYGKNIKVTGKRGLLVGGQCHAAESVFARVLGSHLSTQTRVGIVESPALPKDAREGTVRPKVQIGQAAYPGVILEAPNFRVAFEEIIYPTTYELHPDGFVRKT